MWIIEHSTTPPGAVNSLSHSGTKSPKNTVHITAFRLPRIPQPAPPSSPASAPDPRPEVAKLPQTECRLRPRQIQLGIELVFLEDRRKVRLTKNCLPACKIRSQSFVGIVSW